MIAGWQTALSTFSRTMDHVYTAGSLKVRTYRSIGMGGTVRTMGVTYAVVYLESTVITGIKTTLWIITRRRPSGNERMQIDCLLPNEFLYESEAMKTQKVYHA